MTKEEILEYNKRCAEFLGFKYHEGSEYWTTLLWGGNGFTLRQMRFHSDWNWIMEVVEAIEKLESTAVTIWFRKEGCTIEQKRYEDEDFYVSEKVKTSKKEAVVQAINQFLIWYETKYETN